MIETASAIRLQQIEAVAPTRARAECLMQARFDVATGAHVHGGRRSFSMNVRRTPASVSANVRQEVTLIARRAVYHCATLQI